MFIVSRGRPGWVCKSSPARAVLCGSGLMTAARIVLLLGAGAVAGMVGSAGGTASLIAYPALLAVGIAPLPADVTLSVAFVAAWPGSALGSQPELRGQGTWLRARRRSPQRAARLAPRCCLSHRRTSSAESYLSCLPSPRSPCSCSRRSLPGWQAAASAPASFSCPAPGRRIGLRRYWSAGASVITLALLMITTGQRLPGPTRSRTCCSVSPTWRAAWFSSCSGLSAGPPQR